MPIVVDASALVAPDVVNPEVLSALRRLERTGVLTARRAVQVVDDLMDAPVRRFSTLPLLAEAWTLRADVAAADACHVVLARSLRCPLITGDRRLFRAPGLGVPLVMV
jgi:predicted nucleic acid-binding protein